MPQLDKLTLHLDGHRITADRFRRAVDSFFEMVNSVSEAVTGQRKAVEWIVSVKSGSIDLVSKPEAKRQPAAVPLVVNAIYSGIQQLSKKDSNRPEYFDDNALEKARDLVTLQDGKGVSKVQVRRSRSRVIVNDRLARNVDRILGNTLPEIGSIEGRLDMVSARGGFHAAIYEALFDRPVRCHIPPELEQQALSAFRKRVAAFGPIRYRPTGEPISIDVNRLELFPDSEKLPSADSVYGILSKS